MGWSAEGTRIEAPKLPRGWSVEGVPSPHSTPITQSCYSVIGNTIFLKTVFDLSKKAVRGRATKARESRRRSCRGVECGEVTSPPRERGRGIGDRVCDFFHFKIVHSGAFSYTNSKVLCNQVQENTLSWYSWRLTVTQI